MKDKIMITVIGHGYIGSAIFQHLEVQSYYPVTWISHNEPVPQNSGIIVNAAGYTGSPNVDACENNKMQTLEGNCVWPVHLEEKNKDIPIIHISSGCVYTGYKPGGWTETDTPNFDFTNGSWYSGSKVLEEKLLQAFMHKSYLLRIRMPFGPTPHPKNLLTKLEKYEKLVDYENSLTYVPDIARAVDWFIRNTPEYGCYNLCNPGSKTTKQIVDKMGLEKKWFTHQEFKEAVVAPRSNCVLNTQKLEKIFSIQNIDAALDVALKEYKKNV